MSWQITIHSLAGKLCEVTVDGSSLVCDVKTRVFEATGVPVSQQRLLCGTTELDDDYALESFADPCTELSLVVRPIEHVLWLQQAEEDPHFLRKFPLAWQVRDVVYAAFSCVRFDHMVWEYCPAELKGDRDFFLGAIQRTSLALKPASAELRGDRDFVLAAVRLNGHALQFAPDGLRGDRGVVLAAVRDRGCALEFASTELRGDRDVVLSAVQHRGMALQFASAELRGDCDVVLAAVQQSCFALQFASTELRGDRDVVLAAVRRDGRAFRFASAELRGDRDFVLAVVHRDWSALQFASCELWDNRDVVLAAVQRDYRALRFASAQLRGYLERWALMVLAGVQKNSRKKRALENAPVDGFRPKRQQTESLAA